MDYIFGKRLYDGMEVEFVKTSSDDEYSNFPDGKFVSYVYDNGLMTITHDFRVIRKFKEAVDLRGKFEVWYYIDNHTQVIDNSQQTNSQLSNHAVQLAEQSDAIDDIIISILGGE